MERVGFSRQIKVTSILGQALSDDELAIRARSLLRWNIRYNSIHVEAENGHLMLSGEVDTSSDRDAAEQIIRRLRGVAGLQTAFPNTPSPPKITIHKFMNVFSSLQGISP
jgi:osmotically-inducible protein OsmY